MFPQKSPTHLNILSWNVNGIKAIKPELDDVLSRFDVDIAAIQETRLTTSHSINLLNYHTYRHDHPTNSNRSVAILIKKSLSFHTENTIDTQNIHNVGLTVHTKHDGRLTVRCVYKAPGDPILKEDIEALLAGNRKTVLIGDLNSKHTNWNSRLCTTNGRRLDQFVEECDGIVIAPTTPTHYPDNPNHRPDTIDVAILKDITHDHEISSLDEGPKAHNPVLLSLTSTHDDDDQVPTTKSRLDYSLLPRKLKQFIQIPTDIKTKEDVEIAVAQLESNILAAIQDATSTTTAPQLSPHHTTYPPRVRRAITERNRAKRLYQRTRDPRHRDDYHFKNRLTQELTKEFYGERWQDKIKSLDTRDRSLWKVAKSLRLPSKILPPLHSANGLVFTDQDKAESFADAYERNTRLYEPPDIDQDHEELVDGIIRTLRRTQNLDPPHEPVSPAEVHAIIRILKGRSAPGPDKIPTKVLKVLPKKGLVALSNIANAILRLNYFPQRWKEATVIMIPKPNKDPVFPQNYRPISLLNTLSKVVERLILARLKRFTEELQVTPHSQFGFRSQHSSELQILRLSEMITEGLNRREATGIVLFDVEQAFDRVWHNGLLHKLLLLSYPISLIKLIRSYLSNRRIRVRVNNSLSGLRFPEAGVPQGAVLSPHLFNIFTHDIPSTDSTSTALYADDTAFAAQSRNATLVSRRLQKATDNFEAFCADWKIKINETKTQSILIRRRRIQPDTQITVNGTPIPWSDEVKYLGVYLDKAFTWKRHIQHVKSKAKIAHKKLFPLLTRTSQLTTTLKLLLINMVIRPTMSYASVAWGHAAKTHIKSLTSLENRYIRNAIGAPWFIRNSQIHREFNIVPFHNHIRDRAKKLYLIAPNHDNPLIREATEYDPRPKTSYKRPKTQILDD